MRNKGIGDGVAESTVGLTLTDAVKLGKVFHFDGYVSHKLIAVNMEPRDINLKQTMTKKTFFAFYGRELGILWKGFPLWNLVRTLKFRESPMIMRCYNNCGI